VGQFDGGTGLDDYPFPSRDCERLGDLANNLYALLPWSHIDRNRTRFDEATVPSSYAYVIPPGVMKADCVLQPNREEWHSVDDIRDAFDIEDGVLGWVGLKPA
jgi:hypothetical protein